MLALQKIFDDSVMQIEQLKREKEKFERGTNHIEDMQEKIDTLEAQLEHQRTMNSQLIEKLEETMN